MGKYPDQLKTWDNFQEYFLLTWMDITTKDKARRSFFTGEIKQTQMARAYGEFFKKRVLEADYPDLEELPFMVSDVLFNPVWLNNEHFQLDRPLPLLFGAGISSLGCLIGLDTDDWADPPTSVAMPLTQAATLQVVGLEGFFKGAYAYHWHT
jgi:hypothetical protein